MASLMVNNIFKNSNNKNMIEKLQKLEVIEMIPNNRKRQISRSNSTKDKKIKELKVKYMTTFILYFCSFIFGVATYMNALTLIDLQQMLNTSIEKISIVFTIFSISFIIGSILSGVLFNLFGRQICAIIFLSIIGVCDALTPYSPSIWFLFVLTLLKGLSCGGFNTAILVWIIDMWKQESAPYIHALLFWISLGSFITPIVYKQYLISDNNDFCFKNQINQKSLQNMNSLENSSFYPQLQQYFENFSVAQNFSDPLKLFNHSFVDYYHLIEGTNTENLTQLKNSTVDELKTCAKELLLNIPYACEGFLALCGSAFLFIFLIDQKEQEKFNHRRGSKKRHKQKLLHSSRLFSDGDSLTSVKSWRRNFFITSGSILLSAYIGMEFTNFQILATFSRSTDLKLSGPDSALIMLALLGSFTLFRGISTFIAISIKPQIMGIINFVLIIMANMMLIIFGNHSFLMIIFASILLGAGFSSTLPSIYVFLEQYIHFNNNIGSIFIFSGGLMSAINTAFIGKNLLFLLFMNLFFIIIVVIMVIIIWCSKCLVSSGNYTLNSHQTEVKESTEKEDDFDSEYDDTIVSYGSYHKSHSLRSIY